MAGQGSYEARVSKAADVISFFMGEERRRYPLLFGLTLGTGMSYVADEVEDALTVPYEDIPFFPQVGVDGHEGKMVIGSIEGVPLAVLSGRKHFYEVGYRPGGIDEVVFPVHTLAEMKTRNYFATNAAGAVAPIYKVGEIVVIKDHRSEIPDPLMEKKSFLTIDGKETKRFQPLNDLYDEKLGGLLKEAARRYQTHGLSGVYRAVTGPSFETTAQMTEYRRLGIDMVGMSTAPEAIVAKNRGMNVIAFSLITNVPDLHIGNPADGDEVVDVQKDPRIQSKVKCVIKDFFRLYRESYIEKK
jgi:purine-nucleoside phosphorylase